MRGLAIIVFGVGVLPLVLGPAQAGPPYQTDDPEPTDTGHYEIYAFSEGTDVRAGRDGGAGIDFNYGAAPDLQLSAVASWDWTKASGGDFASGFGDLELEAKYRFVHQSDGGWLPDVSVFPALVLPTGDTDEGLGSGHLRFVVPLWAQWDFGKWSTFGGAQYQINPGTDNRNAWFLGWALTRQVTERLQLGVELYHATPDSRDAKASTGLGFGAIYDLSEHYHLIGSIGPGIQNAAEEERYAYYAALEFTF